MSDLLNYLQSLSSSNSAVSIEQIEQLIKKMPENITTAELHDLINFVSEQLGILEAEWAFSPLTSPNTIAKTKAEAWDKLWKVCSSILFEQVPDAREL
jgi:hypothetical protein